MKSITYLRVSTELQKEEGTIDIQRMKIKEFIVNYFSGVYTKISNTLLNDSNL
jgi:DNA invertase Pin-like site-specific DNA recombinase